MVAEVRVDSSLVVVPTTWVLANNKPPVFYLNPDCVEIVFDSAEAGESNGDTAAEDGADKGKKKKKSSCTVS